MSRYIDADAFIEDIKTEAMNLFWDGLKGTPRPRKELYDIIDRIESQPTADVVEVRHGYWLSAYEYSLRFDISEERRNETKNDTIWKFCNLCEQAAKWDYNYCPNCGAKMDGERREE